MSCLRISNQQTSWHIQNKKCQLAILKISLAAFGILFIGLAIATHMGGLTPYVNSVNNAMFAIGATIIGSTFFLSTALIEIVQRCCKSSPAARAQNSGTGVNQNVSEAEHIYAEALDEQISQMRDLAEKLKNHTDQLENHASWAQMRLKLCLQASTITEIKRTKLDKNPKIQQQLHEYAELENNLMQISQENYRSYIQTLGKKELLKAAQRRYHSYLTGLYGMASMKGVESLTLETILPKLKKVIQFDDTSIMEIKELIPAIERALA